MSVGSLPCCVRKLVASEHVECQMSACTMHEGHVAESNDVPACLVLEPLLYDYGLRKAN